MRQLITIVLWILLLGFAQAQESETIRQSIDFASSSSENMLIIRNINGNIDVEKHNRNSVEFELEIRIRAADKEAVKIGRQEIGLGVVEKSKTILLYMETPCSEIDPKSALEEDIRAGQFQQWNEYCRWNPQYDYFFNYKVKVPENIHLKVSTVNHGDIEVTDHQGKLSANNVNGSITLYGIAGGVNARTINGDLNITYRSNPGEASDYYTLNGTINAHYVSGLSANMYFKTFNGNFYTDIDALEIMPTEIEKEVLNEGKGVKFKIGKNQGVKVRNGGTALKFETFNGDVYVREK